MHAKANRDSGNLANPADGPGAVLGEKAVARGTSLTTKQLAAAIALAVVAAWDDAEIETSQRPLSEVVMDTLDANGAWFCKKTEDPVKGTVFTQLPLIP